MMYKLRFKLIGYFARALLLSLLLSSAFMVLMCAGFAQTELLRSQNALMGTARALHDKTSLSPAEIIETLSSTDSFLHVAGDADLTEAEYERLRAGASVSKGHFFTQSIYFLLGDTLLAVEAYPANSLLINALLRSLLGNILLIAMGFGVVYVMSRRMAQPIVNLTEATREIAKGNFDINVDSHLPRFSGGVKEVAELTATFNQMARDLKNVEYLRRDFTSNLSHELKTPVASINGYARLLQCEGITDADRKEYARIIARESAKLASLSDNLLEITRLENRTSAAGGVRFSLDEQLRRCVAALQPTLEGRRQELSVALARTFIETDADLLSQVWTNLIDNASKFTPEGGKISITLTRARGEARVVVADTGIGMDKATQSRIFEKFYQADSSHHVGGNGLGLPLTRRIVELLGGRIEIESEIGAGSRFAVILPEKKAATKEGGTHGKTEKALG